jgi:pyrroloquinoline quinone biosynthesis protein A
MPAGPSRRILGPVPNRASVAISTNLRRHTMTWETPNAVDFRFGFEITMYIATR